MAFFINQRRHSNNLFRRIKNRRTARPWGDRSGNLNKGPVIAERRYNAIRDGALEPLGIAYDQYRFTFDGVGGSPELQIVNVSGLKL
ncbi:MAG TPA: hypothetical protein VK673_19990 [Chthoniobacterales bacterium]|nr:hypothetical protein [Chthoniobacterales bacterium]